MHTHETWTTFHAVLAQNDGANPLFNQANPGAAPSPGAPAGNGTTAAPAPGGGQPAPGPGGSPLNLMLLFGVVIVVMFLFQALAGRKQDKKRKELLASLKKYDRVVTVGGLIGTVMEVRDDEVVLKVDEHSSTKIRFTRAAVQQVLRPPGEGEQGPRPDPESVETKIKGEGVGAKN